MPKASSRRDPYGSSGAFIGFLKKATNRDCSQFFAGQLVAAKL